MKKILKWVLLILGVLLIFLVVSFAALYFFFPLEQIKEYALAKLSETLGREVRIGKVSLDIFSGIKLEKIYLANRPGFSPKPFLSADSLELRYAFWPLFSRKIIVQEIRLIKPELLIEKSTSKEFNFSDLIKPQKPKPAKPKEAANPPFDLLINTFTVKEGKVIYLDHSPKAESEIKNLEAKISGFALALVKPLEIYVSADLGYQGKSIPLACASKVEIDLGKEALEIPSLTFSLAKEKIFASARAQNLRKAPQIDLFLSTNKFSLDPLLAFLAPSPELKKPSPKPGELTKNVNRLIASFPKNLVLKLKLDAQNLTFQNFKIDKIVSEISFAGRKISAHLKEIRFYEGTLSGKAEVNLVPGLSYQLTELKLINFNAHPFSNAVAETFLTNLPDYQELFNKVYGILSISGELKGKGVEAPEILANASAKGTLILRNGELKRLKIMNALAEELKASALKQDLKVSEFSTNFSFQNKILNLDHLLIRDTDLNLGFRGAVDLNRLRFSEGNRLTLKASPTVTKDLPKEFNLFRNDLGWLELTFELKGELKKPLPVPILEKPLEKGIEKLKVKIEAKKIELEKAAEEKLEAEKKRLEEEAQQKAEEEKKHLEEEAKKKLREMIKF